MAVPIIIPFYKNQRQLDLCLAAIAKQDTPVEPWIYDNSVENLYYTKAENLGLKRAIKEHCEFAIVHTQDCYLRPDAVSRTVEFLRAHPRCALAGIKQVHSSDEDLIVHGGCTIAYPAGRHYSGRKSRGDCNVSAKMPWINGACVFARIDAVIEIGLMDENMLMIGSDSDWCYTARARGWEVWYCAEGEAVHEVGVSNRTTNPQLAALMGRDMDYWRDKWVGSALHARLDKEFNPIPPGYIRI